MREFRIRGGRKLAGELRVSGAKNAVLPILAACVLNESESVIHNCPAIQDTVITEKILDSVGCKTRREGGTLIVDSAGMDGGRIPHELVSEMRSSIVFMGAMLGRAGKVSISYPGGCELGDRPIDLHIKALKRLGADINEDGGELLCRAKKLTGANIHMDFCSVGATENVMLAAALASGTTIVTNAAKEPEIIDLQGFLNAMGADVRGAGTGTIVINGVKKLRAAEYRVMPDRIVAGTYLTAAAAAGGTLTLTHAEPERMFPIIARLSDMGCVIRESKTELQITAPPRLKALRRLITEPYPGYPTDMQAQAVAALTLADGVSVVTETIFNSRNRHAAELKRMGADITLSQDGATFVIRGRPKLSGASVEARDLRGGAALIIAGLAAEGETVVKNAHFVERGYERIEEALSAAGADVCLHQEQDQNRGALPHTPLLS